MTKSTMITTIQAKYKRAVWNSVWGLMKDMGIKTLDRDVR